MSSLKKRKIEHGAKESENKKWKLDMPEVDGILHAAIIEGNLYLMSILLENGVSINSQDSLGETPLHYAVQEGNLILVMELLENHANTNSQNKNGDTPLHIACRYGHSAIMMKLLEDGAAINAENYQDETPIHYASRNGHVSILKNLIQNGAYTNVLNVDGSSMLHHACAKGRVEVMVELLKLGMDLNFENNLGESPLYLALKNGQTQVVSQLINNFDLDVNAKCNHRTILEIAFGNGHVNAVMALLEAGANLPLNNPCIGILKELWEDCLIRNKGVEYIAFYFDFNKDKIKQEEILLLLAAEYGNAKLIKQLVEIFNVNPNVKDRNFYTPLHMAWSRLNVGCIDAIVELLKAGADLNVKDELGKAPIPGLNFLPMDLDKDEIVLKLIKLQRKPLHFATAKGFVPGIGDLIKDGISPNARDDIGNSPLHIASMSREIPLEALIELLKNGALPDIENNKRETPLQVAIEKGNEKVVRILLEYDANPNKTSGHHRESPLHLACKLGNVSIVKILLKHGADFDAKNGHGDTPIHMAIGSEQRFGCLYEYEIVSELLKSGSDLNIKNLHGETPLHTAIELEVDVGLVQDLLEHGADPNAMNNSGNTPIHEAITNHCDTDILQKLLEHGGNINRRDTSLKTSTEIALQEGYSELFAQLVFYQHFQK